MTRERDYGDEDAAEPDDGGMDRELVRALLAEGRECAAGMRARWRAAAAAQRRNVFGAG